MGILLQAGRSTSTASETPIATNLLAMLVDAGLANHGETRSGEGVFYQSQAPSDAGDD